MARTLIIELTYDRDVDVTSAEAMAEALQDGEGVIMVTARMANAPIVRITENDDEPECDCVYKDDPYKAPEQHARTCPIWKLAGLDG